MKPKNSNEPRKSTAIPSSPDFSNIAHNLHQSFISVSSFVFSNTFKVNPATIF